jgi:hypothetical protein
MKSVFFAISMLTFGCSTLPRAGADYATPLSERGRPGALVSGPAILHLNTGGAGAVSIYLADDSGARGDSCPTSAADSAPSILVMKDAAHVSDVPIPGGKRACARFETGGDMSLSWLAEVFPNVKATEGVEAGGDRGAVGSEEDSGVVAEGGKPAGGRIPKGMVLARR